MKPIIFDLDDTLTERNSAQLLPGIKEWWRGNGEYQVIAILSNQGGVGLKHWMESNHFGTPDIYPTEANLKQRMAEVYRELDTEVPYYFAFRYQTQKGSWSPVPDGRETEPCWSKDWRKPAPGMLLYACKIARVEPVDVLYVGDMLEDEQAAAAAGCAFEYAFSFFGRTVPVNYRPKET